MTGTGGSGGPGDSAGSGADRPVLTLADLTYCFEGVVPAVIASASADGVPNITYLSRVCLVDDGHVALSNQFFSKTSRNLAENPRASLLMIDPVSYDEFRLTVVYERTERRGRVFERLSDDVDTVASLTGMTDVFKLRAADVYRVLDIEQVLTSVHRQGVVVPVGADRAGVPGVARAEAPSLDASTLGELHSRLSRYGDLDSLVTAALEALDSVLGHRHSLFLLLDESGGRLFTLATHGFDEEGIGSEVTVGKGIIGMAAARATTIRVGGLRQMDKYSQSVRRAYEGQGVVGPGYSMPVPGLPDAESRVAVPAMALGQLVGVLSIDSAEQVAFGPADEAYLSVVASMLANAVEIERAQERTADDDAAAARRGGAGGPAADESAPSTRVRFFSVDGSTFLDDDYLIKGVAGRILWSLLRHHDEEGRVEFSNKEVRLDPTLELPEFRDNFESRLILLRRRLEERGAPIRIERSGRGRFRLIVDAPLRLEVVDPTPSP